MTDQKGGELPSLTSDSQAADPSASSTDNHRARVFDFDLDDTVNGNLVDTPKRARSHGFRFRSGLPTLDPDKK